MEPPPEASEMAITRYWHCEAAPPVGVPPPDAPAYWLEMEAPEGTSYWKCILELPKSHTPSVPPPLDTSLYLGHYHWERHTGEPAEGEYYHCTGAPAAPGTRPDEDPEHWEPVDPPDEAVFGQVNPPRGWWWADHFIIATRLTFPHGEAIDSVNHTEVDAQLPDTFPSVLPECNSTIHDLMVFAVRVIYAPDTNALVKLQAYVDPSPWADTTYACAIYDAERNLLVQTDTVSFLAGDEFVGWIDLTPQGALTLVDGTDYWLACAGNNAEAGIYVATLPEYVPAEPYEEWDDEEEYEYCQTVYLPPEGETILPDPWHPETTYEVGDVVRYNPVYLEWDPTEENYKWCNFVYYTEPTVQVTVRDGIIAADKEPHHKHKMTLIDTVKAKVFHRFVAPCFGRYIRPPWAIRGGQRD